MAQWSFLADEYLHVAERYGDEVMARCIFHDERDASMQFNVASGLFICFSCGARGNSKTLQRELGLRFREGEIDVADLRARIDALRNPTTDDILPTLEESWLRRYQFPTDYWSERGFDKHTVAAFDLGYDPMGEFVTIPVRDIRGNLLGVIKRFLGDIGPRYREPKGFKKSANLFGSWLVEEDEDASYVVLVEGPIDAMKVWQAGHPALAIYGSSLSPQQARILRRTGLRRIILFFDDDKAGRKCTDSTLGLHEAKRGRKTHRWYDPTTDLSREFIVDEVKYPRRFPADPGGMDNDQIDQMLREARRII